MILAGNLIVQPLSAVLVLVWARISRTPWRDLGCVWPPSWARDLGVGIALGVALKLAMKTAVMPLVGAEAINPRYHHLVGDPMAAAGMLFPIIVGAGWGEETLFRGYLFERLGRLVGRSVPALVATVAITSLLFAVAHEGRSAMLQAGFVGLVLGTIYAVQRRIWMLAFAHAAFDLTAVAIIYWNLEERLHHLFFR